MHVLIASKRLYPPIGGAELSMLGIAKRLSRIHKVSMLIQGTGNVKAPENIGVITIDPEMSILRGQWITQLFESLKWRKLTRKVLRETKPDVVLTQLDFSAPTILASNDVNIPSVLFVRSFEFFCLRDFNARAQCDGKCPYCLEGWKDKIQIPFAQGLIMLQKKGFCQATKVVANSQFMARKCFEYFNRNVEIIYPIGWEDMLRRGKEWRIHEPEHITMITPMIHKGVQIFLDIARSMPQEKFLAVGRTCRNLRARLEQTSVWECP